MNEMERYIVDLLNNKNVVRVMESAFYREGTKEDVKKALDNLVKEGRILKKGFGKCEEFDECGQLIDLERVKEGDIYECRYGHEQEIYQLKEEVTYYQKRG